MNYTNEQINIIIDKYVDIVDKISTKYNYDNNIKHLLYIVVPIFVIKYGLENERIIVNLFDSVEIVINDVNDRSNPALFSRMIFEKDGKYELKKNIVIKNYSKVDLINLLDSMIHEFNHAINSIKNEIIITNDNVTLRTGISIQKYDLKLNKVNSENITLEEIINTKDTEELINIIKSLSKYNISNYEVNSLIQNVNREISNNYVSDSYYLQSYVAKSLMDNSTFINTLRSLRLSGNISDIDNWFDTITGVKNSFCSLNKMLNDSLKLEKELRQTKFFKNIKLNKIKDNIKNIMNIINLFNDNCNIK